MNLINLRLNDCIHRKYTVYCFIYIELKNEWNYSMGIEVKRDGVWKTVTRKGFREMSQMLCGVFYWAEHPRYMQFPRFYFNKSFKGEKNASACFHKWNNTKMRKRNANNFSHLLVSWGIYFYQISMNPYISSPS